MKTITRVFNDRMYFWDKQLNRSVRGGKVDKPTPDVIVRNCFICQSVESLLRHHIDENRSNAVKKNIVVLCRQCHIEVHKGIVNLKTILEGAI